MRLIVASGNAHKVREIADMLAQSLPELTVIGVMDPNLGLGDPPEPEETETTFSGNAAIKANAIARWLREQGGASTANDVVLADDSGICIDSFYGAPGVYSARFAGEGATDEDNNAKMVADLEGLGLDRSAAHYACVLAVAFVSSDHPAPDPELLVVDGAVCVEGRCHGYVRTKARGDGGFGYDPYFWVDEDARTFAELTQDAKAARSHRGDAFRRLLVHLPALLAN